jgi:nuclear pore complex protein Nup54
MRTRYENIQDHLQRSEQFHGKLTQMWAQLQLIKESGRKYGQLGGVEGWGLVSQEDQDRITKVRIVLVEEKRRFILTWSFSF